MMDLYPYDQESLKEMFSLRKGDISALIRSEGIPLYSPVRESFIGYLPSLRSAFNLTFEAEEYCYSNVKTDEYKVSIKESVICIESKNGRVPASSLLYRNKWLPQANELLEINSDFALLLSKRIDVPVFCGHTKIITRLADNFAGDIRVVNVEDFVRRWRI